jgi:RNA polymerase sigma-70 factor (ECF subfamily)
MAVPLSNLEPGPAPIKTDAELERPLSSLHERVAAIYEATREDVFRYLVFLGVEPDQAQELCQETFLRLYAKLRDGEQVDNIRGWVFTVARNCAHNSRQYARRLQPLDTALESRTSSSDLTPEQQFLREEKMRRLREAFATVSPQQRHCLHLRAEGFRYREIGQILGIGASTVGEFLRRAIDRLRESLYE